MERWRSYSLRSIIETPTLLFSARVGWRGVGGNSGLWMTITVYLVDYCGVSGPKGTDSVGFRPCKLGDSLLQLSVSSTSSIKIAAAGE
jgi:hypothetical protein